MEPCQIRYAFDKSLVENEHKEIGFDITSFDSYIDSIREKSKFFDLLKYEEIRIVEKED